MHVLCNTSEDAGAGCLHNAAVTMHAMMHATTYLQHYDAPKAKKQEIWSRRWCRSAHLPPGERCAHENYLVISSVNSGFNR